MRENEERKRRKRRRKNKLGILTCTLAFDALYISVYLNSCLLSSSRILLLLFFLLFFCLGIRCTFIWILSFSFVYIYIRSFLHFLRVDPRLDSSTRYFNWHFELMDPNWKCNVSDSTLLYLLLERERANGDGWTNLYTLKGEKKVV